MTKKTFRIVWLSYDYIQNNEGISEVFSESFVEALIGFNKELISSSKQKELRHFTTPL